MTKILGRCHYNVMVRKLDNPRKSRLQVYLTGEEYERILRVANETEDRQASNWARVRLLEAVEISEFKHRKEQGR